MFRVLDEKLNVRPDNLGPLYVLKYHLEQEFNEDSDSCIQFLNGIITVFCEGNIDRLDSVKDFSNANKEELPRVKERNLKNHLRVNSGLTNSPYTSAVYDGKSLVIGRKDVTMYADGSIALAVKTQAQLKYFLDTLMQDYSYKFTRIRANELKEVFGTLIEEDCFSHTDNILLCVGTKDTTKKTMSYTLFGKEYVKDIEDLEDFYCDQTTVEFDKVFFDVWVI